MSIEEMKSGLKSSSAIGAVVKEMARRRRSTRKNIPQKINFAKTAIGELPVFEEIGALCPRIRRAATITRTLRHKGGSNFYWLFAR